MRIFVCSPLRGPDGQPSASNIAQARRLMRAVLDAGHSPFVPHLLYPQVLTESPDDLKRAFEANYAFLAVCDEIWVFAKDKAGCSKGMRAEVEWCERQNAAVPKDVALRPIEIRFMPEVFSDPFVPGQQSGLGVCSQCSKPASLNHNGWCFDCFSEGSATPVGRFE